MFSISRVPGRGGSQSYIIIEISSNGEPIASHSCSSGLVFKLVGSLQDPAIRCGDQPPLLAHDQITIGAENHSRQSSLRITDLVSPPARYSTFSNGLLRG